VFVDARALACACARVVLLTQHATCHHIAISGISGFTKLFDIVNGNISEKKVIEQKMCVFIFSTVFV
jgi:hypothetical protein